MGRKGVLRQSQGEDLLSAGVSGIRRRRKDQGENEG